MTPYVRQLISESDYQIFLGIRQVVEKLPDLTLDDGNEGDEISCHMLVRALKPFFPVNVCDGFFYGYYQHSWLETKGGHVIDIYPVGILGGPILVEASICRLTAPSQKLYRKNSRIYRGKFSKPEI